MRIRVKFGMNPYSNNFTCSSCGDSFNSGGFILRLEHAGKIVDIPVCAGCYKTGVLFEGMIDLSEHHTSHPIGRA